MKHQTLTAKEYFEKLEWLAREMDSPADITVHTQQAKIDLTRIIITTVEMLKIVDQERNDRTVQ